MILQNNVLVQLDNNPRIKELNNLCSSDNLSLSALQEKLNLLDKNDISLVNSCYNTPGSVSCFHRVCMNKNVTLDIIQSLLNTFPKAAEWPTHYYCPSIIASEFSYPEDNEKTLAYPLHLCCYNEHCNSDVIELLVGLFPKPLDKVCIIGDGIRVGHYNYWDCDYIQTVPIGYYFARDSNISIDAVRVLVEANPESLMTDCFWWEVFPLHIALVNNGNIKESDLFDIVTFCIEAKPFSVEMIDGTERTLLHVACLEGAANLELVRYIYSKWPAAIQRADRDGRLPLHDLCDSCIELSSSLDILRFLLINAPASVREADYPNVHLPIHIAIGWGHKSFAFCKILLDAYPESARITMGSGTGGDLPIHCACDIGRRDDIIQTIRYLLKLYPQSINIEARCGWLPIHYAARKGNVEVIKLLLQCDPETVTKKTEADRWNEAKLPLHVACEEYPPCFDAAQLLYDIYPEAILDGKCLERMLGRGHSHIFAKQLVYAEKAQDLNALATSNENGWLPLHHALNKNASLGSIKLLLQGNPSAIQVSNRTGVSPLHLASEFSSVGVVHYLIGKLDDSMLDHIDGNGDTILHCACRGGNLAVVNYLSEKHASLVSIVDSQNRLPIHLFCEADNDKRESPEYVETVWRLLLASPEVFSC